MPLYEFQCLDCKSHFEEIFLTSNPDLADVECPSCHARRAEKLLSVFATDTRSSTGASSQPMGGCGSGCGCHSN